VIASGGVTNASDVEAITALAPGRIVGMIIGKALYEGTLTLEQAIKIASADGGE
jgi:phosphoribosylformimino-5-aminoimidazole carboxamide ribotide isomerase